MVLVCSVIRVRGVYGSRDMEMWCGWMYVDGYVHEYIWMNTYGWTCGRTHKDGYMWMDIWMDTHGWTYIDGYIWMDIWMDVWMDS